MEKDIVLPKETSFDEKTIKWYDAGCSDMDNYFCRCRACESAMQHQTRRLQEYDPILNDKLIHKKKVAKSKNMVKYSKKSKTSINNK